MRAAAWTLVVLALLHMTADLAGWRTLEGLAAATGASPAPRVFSAVRGLETYSTEFALHWTDRSGSEQRLDVTAELAARIRGPYNRRNIYGAVLAYGPVLITNPDTRPMFASVANYALVEPAALLTELGLDRAALHATGSLRIVYTPVAGTDMGALPATIALPVAPLAPTSPAGDPNPGEALEQ